MTATRVVGGSALLTLTIGRGVAVEYDNGNVVRSEPIRTTTFGVDTNLSVQGGIAVSSTPEASLDEVLGMSFGHALTVNLGFGSLAGSDEISTTDRAVQSEGGVGSVGAAAKLGASPLSYSIYGSETALNVPSEYVELKDRRLWTARE